MIGKKVSEQSCRFNGDSIGTANKNTESVYKDNKSRVKNGHHNTNYACKGIQALHNTETTFQQNKEKVVNFDEFDEGFGIENNDHSIKDKSKDELSYVNKNQDKLRSEELNVTNDFLYNNYEDKSIVRTKEETTLGEDSPEKKALKKILKTIKMLKLENKLFKMKA